MKVHLVGIGGSGMSALAHLYLARGDRVSGSDATASSVTEALGAIGAEVTIGHRADSLDGAELVVVSTAIKTDNPELVEARRRGLRVITRGRAAAALAAERRQVAVAGTHGKTTTTTMVAAVLAATDPLVLSGGRLPGSLYNSRGGKGPFAVVEADESDRSFLELVPEVAVVTNIEADHLDRYRDLEEIERAFEAFARRVTGTLVACIDDPGALVLLETAATEVVSYGFAAAAEVHGSDYVSSLGGCSFLVESPWGRARVELRMPGRHNAANALGAIAAGLVLGRPLPEVVTRLAEVELPGRRLELVAEVNGARVYDDYGHHPTEVAATLSAAREICTGRLVCAFQPHRYSRLKAMLDAFGTSFGSADEVILLPVYGAGEAPVDGATSQALADSIRRHDPGRPVEVLASLELLPDALRGRLHRGDVAVCMGAGDIQRVSLKLKQP
jgi:UDP-N-acetylmuramate--alanine ligase